MGYVVCHAVLCSALLLSVILQTTTGAKAFKRVHDNEWLDQKGSWSNRYEDTFGARWVRGHASTVVVRSMRVRTAVHALRQQLHVRGRVLAAPWAVTSTA